MTVVVLQRVCPHILCYSSLACGLGLATLLLASSEQHKAEVSAQGDVLGTKGASASARSLGEHLLWEKPDIAA